MFRHPLLLFLTATVIELGSSPWRFAKITDTDEQPLSADSVVDGIRYYTLPGKSGRLVVTFPGEEVKEAGIRLEGSTDGHCWVVLDDGGERRKLDFVRKGTIADVAGTVGYTQATTATRRTSDVDGNLSHVRMVGTHGTDLQSCQVSYRPVTPSHAPEEYASSSFDDSAWQQVGIPHCYNEDDTYLNTSTGERCWRGEAWYRKKLYLDRRDRKKRVILEFQSVNIATTVYVNGHAVPGRSAVPQPEPVTHVGSSLPFSIDITEWVDFGSWNQLAIRVSNSNGTFFTYPGFGENEGFGQAMGGITAPLRLHLKDPIAIPLDSPTPTQRWGMYAGTLTADEQEATVRIQTCVWQDGGRQHRVTLVTDIVDAEGHTVASHRHTQQLQADTMALFDHVFAINHPHLWYPVGSAKGTPYLYKVHARVYEGCRLCDERILSLGIRTVRFDDDYCYINGERTLLRGFGNRNIYPALGAAVPAALQWEDIRRIADCGGNTLRVGHQPPYTEAADACDAYGIMLILNSGDNEWSLHDEPALTYKWEYDRDAMIAFRNHPSVIVWESNNGLAYTGERYLPSRTLQRAQEWDYLQQRPVLNRDGVPPAWPEGERLIVGYTNRYEKQTGYPSLNTEVYGANWIGLPSWCIARDDYANEKEFSMDYVNNYLHDVAHGACGWIDWMLAETYGEGYTIYLNGRRNQKSLGSCAMDGNRFPKLKYRIYRDALWVPVERRPGIALQSTWRREGDTQDVDAWTNCAQAELFVGGISRGIVIPDSATRRCTWPTVAWEPGMVVVQGQDGAGRVLASDTVRSCGAPCRLELWVEKPADKPDGTPFTLRANGSDAFVVTARVVDAEGVWCPDADPLLTFSTQGPCTYKGSYNFYVTDTEGLGYHAPGDRELRAEGGLMRVALRTTFQAGSAKVRVSSPGLLGSEVTVVIGADGSAEGYERAIF